MLKIQYKSCLESVVVCVDYSDYLKYFLKYNLKHFNKLVIVTKKEDKKTIQLCKKYKTEYIFTKRLHERGATFNKGKAINDGLKCLSMKNWVLLTDADMIFENDFRENFDKHHLNKDFLYGTLRYNCSSYNIWKKYSLSTFSEQKEFLFNKLERLRKGCNKRKRISGYFQLFHAKKFNYKKNIYPERWKRANKSDKYFVQNWKMEEREYLKNIYAWHFDHGGQMGINWDGRKSPEFKKDNPIINNNGKENL